jgi:hypothetical protein
MTGGGVEKVFVVMNLSRRRKAMEEVAIHHTHRLQLILLDTSNSPRAAYTTLHIHDRAWGESEKGINKKLRDHIMEEHTNNNKQQP